MVVLVLALLVFGPAKLPELLGSLGHAIREFQRASRELTEVFQETQQEFQSALDLDAQHQTQTAASYEVPAEEASYTMAPEPPVTSRPEEFETAAAMVDPVAPFQYPVEPEPVVAIGDTAKPKRVRRRKAAEPIAEEPVAEEPMAQAAGVDDAIGAELVAEPAAASDAEITRTAAVVADPPTAELAETPPKPKRASRRPPPAPAITPGISATTPLAEPLMPSPSNGSAQHVNGTEPKPRRRRAAVGAARATSDELA